MRILHLISVISFLLFQYIYPGTIKIPQDFPTIQTGIVGSSNGDTVLISPGTYFENINFNGKNIVLGSFFLTTGDTFYISQTVINGSQQGCVVVFESGEDTTTILSGFTITNGYSFQDSLRGGGITCRNSSNPKLSNLIVADNKVDGNGESYGGGGIYCLQQSSPIIENMYIQNNHVTEGLGGGIYLRDSSNVKMTNLTVKDNNNERGKGGGIVISYSKVLIKDSQIVENLACEGGGIYTKKSSLEINNSIINKNITIRNGRGGGIGSIYSEIIIKNSKIKFNEALHKASIGPMCQGGGFYAEHSSLKIENCDINNNLSETDGGGISIQGSDLKIYRSLIKNNRASLDLSKTMGGGINIIYSSSGNSLYMEEVLVVNNYSGGYGGGIYFAPEKEMEVFNKTIIKNNSAGISGGGISTNSNLVITDTSKCSIYLNKAKESGNDISMTIVNSFLTKSIYLDTVTVSAHNDYQVSPINKIDLQYNHALYQTTDSDLYVSSDGSDKNSGNIPSEPLKTINRALLLVNADSLHPRIVNIAGGFYSPTVTGEEFPLYGRSYVTLKGENVNSTILDGGGKSRIIEYSNIKNSSFKNITIQNGFALKRTTTDGEIVGGGGGVYGKGERDVVIFENMIVRDNRARYAGGGLYLAGNVELNKVLISNNILDSASDFVGGTGVSFRGYKTAKLINTTISNNYAINGSPMSSGLSISLKDILIVNSIIWGNHPENISISSRFLFGTLANITVSHSNIEGNQTGILNYDSMKVNWLDGNIDADPLFIGGEPFDYILSDNSPSINAGTSLFVWGGDTLINLAIDEYIGDAPDMGALESDVTISVEDDRILPTEFKLEQNYPNPFNPSTTIKYSIHAVGKKNTSTQHISLKIYDILGKEVTTLVNKVQKPGSYKIQFEVSSLTSGIYFYQLKTKYHVQTKKMIIIQ